MIDFKNYPFLNAPYAVSVCRIEPENNIELILEAFSIGDDFPLVVVGNWSNSDYGTNLLRRYNRLASAYLLNPIYDPEKINYLRSRASVYVHGHSAGGTNPSLVEAMFLGLPVFAFDCVYNRYTTEGQCVYWSDSNELRRLVSETGETELKELGKRMKRIATEKYRWKVIIEKYEKLYG
jgi:glycosyltransferase involved in cell wall biosynthesis